MMTAQENLGAEFSLEEIYARFPDEWIALFVTDDGGYGRSLRGHLIAHGRDRGRMYAAELDFARSHPGAHTAVFFAGPVTDADSDTVIVFLTVRDSNRVALRARRTGVETLAVAAGARSVLVDTGALIHYAPVRAVTHGEEPSGRLRKPALGRPRHRSLMTPR